MLTFCGVTLPWLARPGAEAKAVEKHQSLGQFCGGSCIPECTKTFGDGLANACRTCPN